MARGLSAHDASRALDPAVVLDLLADTFEREVGASPASASATVLRAHPKRIVVRYVLTAPSGSWSVVGKWYRDDRGALVADVLTQLAGHDQAKVPRVIRYVPTHRALFVEAIDGPLLKDALMSDQSAAEAAGSWLAAFHGSDLQTSRSVGLVGQAEALRESARGSRDLREMGAGVAAVLDRLPDPALPLHYDFYHSQVLLPSGGPVVIDVDEVGRGDPALDLAHFEAHLELLALRRDRDPHYFDAAREEFRAGYSRVAALPEGTPAFRAYSFFKLACQLRERAAPVEQFAYAVAQVRASLSMA